MTPDNRSYRILVVEDEKNVGLTLVERLKMEGFDVVWAQSCEEARFEASHGKFDLALLDVGLPDGSGFDLSAEVHKTQPSMALIFLTAFGSSDDRIRGLEQGAEDYIVKPFHLKELLLRIENGLKRARYLQGSSDGIKVGKATINFSRFEAIVDNKSVALTQREAALLKLLVERKGAVVSRNEILDHAWSESEYPTSRTVDNFILRLRRLVEENPENPIVIKSIRGVGYQLL